MRFLPLALLSCITLLSPTEARENTIILDAAGVKNLGITTVTATPQTFESTTFAIGRIKAPPTSTSVLSSRIAGRAIRVHAFIRDTVRKDQILVEVESRQPGNPPPIIALKAPQSGLITNSRVRIGQPIEPKNELLHISDHSTLLAIAQIPETDAAKITPGLRARISIPAIGGAPIIATMKRFGIQADQKSGTVQGIFELPNTEGKLQPRMRAEFTFITASRTEIISLPRAALQGNTANPVVFIKDYELPNAFIKSPVITGEKNDQFVEILSGLFPGDQVVTQGAYSLSFAGAGSISLKEALDAAHGHEHNEDGSEITEDQKTSEKTAESKASPALAIYAGIATLAALVFAQLYWKKSNPR